MNCATAKPFRFLLFCALLSANVLVVTYPTVLAQSKKDRSRGSSGRQKADKWDEDLISSRNGMPIKVLEGKLKSINSNSVTIIANGEEKKYAINPRTRTYGIGLAQTSSLHVGSVLCVEGRLHAGGDTGLFVTGHKITYLPPKVGTKFEPYTSREKNSTIHTFHGVIEKLDPLTMRVDRKNTANYEQTADDGRTLQNVMIGGKLIEVWKRERNTEEIEVPLARDFSFQDVKATAKLEMEIHGNGEVLTKIVLIRSEPMKAEELPKPPAKPREKRTSRADRSDKSKKAK